MDALYTILLRVHEEKESSLTQSTQKALAAQASSIKAAEKINLSKTFEFTDQRTRIAYDKDALIEYLGERVREAIDQALQVADLIEVAPEDLAAAQVNFDAAKTAYTTKKNE